MDGLFGGGYSSKLLKHSMPRKGTKTHRRGVFPLSITKHSMPRKGTKTER